MITGYTIDVFREADENEPQIDDINLDEFKDEIDSWVVDALKSAGYQTARQILAASSEEVADQADLEVNTVEDVIKVLKEEFEQE